MRSFFDLSESVGAAQRHPASARHRRLVQVVTLGFWAPCCVADFWLMRRGGEGAAGFVFGLLFREALVFLALWFVAAAAYGLMRGSSEPNTLDARQQQKLRGRLTAGFHGYVAPTRGNRGQ